MEIFFIVQCVKKVSLRKKVGNGAKKRGHKTCVALYFLLSLQKNKEEISKNYTYIITLKKDKNL